MDYFQLSLSQIDVDSLHHEAMQKCPLRDNGVSSGQKVV